MHGGRAEVSASPCRDEPPELPDDSPVGGGQRRMDEVCGRRVAVEWIRSVCHRHTPTAEAASMAEARLGSTALS